MKNQTLASWITRRATISPRRVAVICEGKQWTYAELSERTVRLAHALIGLGVRRGDRVGFYGPNSNGHLETLFACSLLGAIWVPVHFRFGVREVTHAINQSGCTVLVFAPEGAATIERLRPHLGVRTYVATSAAPANTLDYEQLLAQASAEPIDRGVSPEDICLICYTSGTTGTNKGVVLTHGNMVANVYNLLSRSDYMSGDVMLTAAPLFRMGGLGLLTPVFFKGAACVILPNFDPERALELIEQHRVTILFNGPRQFEQMWRSPKFATADLSSIRFCLCGGDVVSPELIRAYLERGITFQQGYGLTETSPAALLLDEHDVLERNGSAGSALLLNDVRIVREDMTTATPGEIGELVIRGPNVMKGYWEQGDIDDQVFAGGWLHTGDAARMDADGFVFIVDRIKDAMTLGFEKVYPSEIEGVLATHPAVAEAAVIALEQDGRERPLAFVVVRAGHKPTTEELGFFCWQRLPPERVPTEVRVIAEMPRNPNGKLMRRKLRELALAPATKPAATGNGVPRPMVDPAAATGPAVPTAARTATPAPAPAAKPAAARPVTPAAAPAPAPQAASAPTDK